MNDLQKYYLTESARWQKLLGIFMAVCTGLLVLLGIFFIIAAIAGLDIPGENADFGKFGLIAMGILYILIAFLYYFFTRYLLRAARGIKTWGESGDEAALTDGLRNNKNFYQMCGILSIISIALIAVTIIGVTVSLLFLA